jgi:aspartate 1-decarboxylase
MFQVMLKAKLHRGTVTDSNLNYVGSISIDAALLQQAGINVYEQVHVVNVTTGARFETYALAAHSGGGEIVINGGAARLVQPGDIVIIFAYGLYDLSELPVVPKILILDDQNCVVEARVAG